MSDSTIEESESLPPGSGFAVRGWLYTVIFHAVDTPGPRDGMAFRAITGATYAAPRVPEGDFMAFHFADETWTLTKHGQGRPLELPSALYRRALRLVAGAERTMSRRVQGYFAPSKVARRQQLIDRHLDQVMVAAEPGSVDDCVVHVFPPDKNSNETLGRVGVMRGRKQIAKLNQNTGILFVDDEGEREAAIELLAQNGYTAAPPLAPFMGRQVTGRLGYISRDPSYVLDLYFDSHPRRVTSTEDTYRLRAALFLPQNRGLVALSDRVEEIAVEVLARHGLPVEARNADVGFPPGCRLATYERLTWDPFHIRQQLPNTARTRAPQVLQPASSGRTLSEQAADLVPGKVADVLRHLLETSPPDFYTPRGPHISWLHRSAVLTQGHVASLLGVAPENTLPLEGQAVAQVAASHRSGHAPLLAAIMLRSRCPNWWNSIDVGKTISEHPGERLWDLSSKARSQSKHAGLLELLASRDFPHPDLPKAMQWPATDEVRLWIAAGAVMRLSLEYRGSGPRDPRVCLVCGREFLVGGLTLDHIMWLGRDECCPGCTDDAFYGSAAPWTSEREAVVPDAVRALAEEWGGPPPRSGLQLPLAPEPVQAWVKSLLHRQVLPNPLRGGSQRAWTSWLADAQVLEGYRPSRGIMSTAADGHMCRSLFERHLDDFFTANGIVHDTEPSYPADQLLNDFGLRADWLLTDGTFVEAAGMMQSPAYGEKITRKRALADKYGLSLVIVEPDDLSRLPDVFKQWLTLT